MLHATWELSSACPFSRRRSIVVVRNTIGLVPQDLDPDSLFQFRRAFELEVLDILEIDCDRLANLYASRIEQLAHQAGHTRLTLAAVPSERNMCRSNVP